MSWMSSVLPSPYQEHKTTFDMTRIAELKDTLSLEPDLSFEHEMETKSRNKGFFALLRPKSHTCLHGIEESFFIKCWVKCPNCLPFANESDTFRCPGSPYILTFHCHLGGLTSKRIQKLFWLLTPWSNTIIQEWCMWKLAIVKTFLHPWPHPEPWILERKYQVLVVFPELVQIFSTLPGIWEAIDA